MAGLLNKCSCDAQKMEKLDDSDGPLSMQISSSSIGITDTCVHQVQQEISSKKRSQGPYILLTPAHKFSIGERAAENGVTATLHYYSKTFLVPGKL